jgi:hypothetical protein
MKTIALIISGRPGGDNVDNVHEIELHPGSTSGDVLRSVGLGTDYLLSLEGAGNPFALEEQIYDAVPDGAKLRAAPVAEVGGARKS